MRFSGLQKHHDIAGPSLPLWVIFFVMPSLWADRVAGALVQGEGFEPPDR